MSVSPREKKTKSINQNHKLFFSISIFCGVWMIPSARYIFFVYLFVFYLVPSTERGTIYSVV